MVMTETKRDASFSLGNLFGGKGFVGGAAPAASLEPHPSVRPHISPLNRLGVASTAEDELPVHPDVRSGVLDNGLPYIILPNKSPPGRFEAHLQVFSGSGTCVYYIYLSIYTSKHWEHHHGISQTVGFLSTPFRFV